MNKFTIMCLVILVCGGYSKEFYESGEILHSVFLLIIAAVFTIFIAEKSEVKK